MGGHASMMRKMQSISSIRPTHQPQIRDDVQNGSLPKTKWGLNPRALNDRYPEITPENQLAMLKQEKEYLKSEMNGISSTIDDISKRIEELEKKE